MGLHRINNRIFPGEQEELLVETSEGNLMHPSWYLGTPQ